MKVVDNELLNRELISKIGIGNDRHPMFCASPILLGEKVFNGLLTQQTLINQFYNIVGQIGKLAIKGEMEGIVKTILFSEVVAGMDIAYHRELDDFAWEPPLFYRTDQSVDGKIFEIQAPGSGWGDLPLIKKILNDLGVIDNLSALDFEQKYISAYRKLTDKQYPHVGYFLDASSNPISMRYLLAVTHNEIGYWEMDANVLMDDLDCVVAHSASALTTLNYFQKYYEKATHKELRFILPPNLLFDQKSIYLLPFLEETKHFFTDEIRQIFPYTTYICDDKFRLENGEYISIDNFIALPSSQRRYYLKYGGPDTNKNWGSKSIYRLNRSDCQILLNMARELSTKGEIWLIQKDITSLSDRTSLDYSADLNNIIADGNHIKLSAFYTPFDYLGCKVMFRKHFKVHGQNDTYTGLGIR